MLEKVHVVMLFMLQCIWACTVPQASGAADREVCLRLRIARVLPVEYAEDFRYTVKEMAGQKLGFVCARPQQWPRISGPWATLFMITVEEDMRIVWSRTFEGDWDCRGGPRVLGRDDNGYIIYLVTRPSSASVMVQHLRVYRYDKARRQPRPVLTLEIVDGGYATLPSEKGCWPAFLVWEPTYETGWKYEPQIYRFRVYVPSQHRHYALRGTFHTRRRYENDKLDAAYEEVRVPLSRVLRPNYSLPDNLCPCDLRPADLLCGEKMP